MFKAEQGWKIITITDTRETQNCHEEEGHGDKYIINKLLDDWHKAAANADADEYFGKIAEDGIYIGTDASERWIKKDFVEWSKKYFEKGKAWDFKSFDRTIYFSDDKVYAWFEESLNTGMGVCHASGVLKYTEKGWKIKHYHLSVTVPNEQIKEFIKLINKKKH